MDIVLRATATFAGVYLLLRLLGKRELGQMTPFELVLLVVMGDLIQQGVTHNDFSVTGAMLAICTFAFWTVVMGWLAYWFPRLKGKLEGEPRIIICNGKLLEENLRRDRVTPSEVESEMRMAGIAHVRDVAFAVLEPQGKISFMRMDQGPVQRGDDDDAAP